MKHGWAWAWALQAVEALAAGFLASLAYGAGAGLLTALLSLVGAASGEVLNQRRRQDRRQHK